MNKLLSFVALFSVIGRSLVRVAAEGPASDAGAPGSAVITTEAEEDWWNSLLESQQGQLMDLFDPEWFHAQTNETQIAYCHVAQSLYDFVETPGIDSRPDDSYTSFAPLLLRSSFHAAGTFHAPSGTGGTNGGTIFNPGELEDGGNACIEPAVQTMQALFRASPRVSLADAMVIGGSVALDIMDFPRMDLLRIQGGRTQVSGLAWRDRLPDPDLNPTELFQQAYDLTPTEFTALIGGGHNFGSAHGVCAGYVGDWTKNPLSWKSVEDPNGSEFFVDLLQEDWRWYEVCTFKNATSVFTSIPDPFAATAIEEEEEEEHELDVCEVHLSEIPFICEEQAMRGCAFEDGAYPPLDPAIVGCQFRLKSDFFLKEDAALRPLSVSFAEDDDLLAEEFGKAYHKLTHAGLSRCGLSGFGCGDSGVCKPVFDPESNQYLTSYCEVNTTVLEVEQGEQADFSLDATGSSMANVAIVILAVCVLLLVFMLARNHTTHRNSSTAASEKSQGSTVNMETPYEKAPPDSCIPEVLNEAEA